VIDVHLLCLVWQSASETRLVPAEQLALLIGRQMRPRARFVWDTELFNGFCRESPGRSLTETIMPLRG